MFIQDKVSNDCNHYLNSHQNQYILEVFSWVFGIVKIIHKKIEIGHVSSLFIYIRKQFKGIPTMMKAHAKKVLISV